jgi:hypothetical protein
MAIDKATTSEDLTASAQDTLPTREQLVERVVEHTDPSTLAKVDAPKTVKVKSPAGTVTEVPEGIVGALLDSGYSKSK